MNVAGDENVAVKHEGWSEYPTRGDDDGSWSMEFQKLDVYL